MADAQGIAKRIGISLVLVCKAVLWPVSFAFKAPFYLTWSIWKFALYVAYGRETTSRQARKELDFAMAVFFWPFKP